MAEFKIKYLCKKNIGGELITENGEINLPHWDESTKTLLVADTETIKFSLFSIDGKPSKDYKFDIYDSESRANYYFCKKDKSGVEIPDSRTDYISLGNPYTVKAKPGRKGKTLWVEYYKGEKSHFETTKGNPSIDNKLGMFVKYVRPEPIIESVEWLDPKTKKEVKKKTLGQYVLLRIKTKHLEGENIKISLWEYDGETKSINKEFVLKHLEGRICSQELKDVSNERIDPITGKTWSGTVKSMDFGFRIDQEVMKEKLTLDGSLDILIHLNPAWAIRKGNDNFSESFGDGRTGDLEFCIKIDHPRLPIYDKETSSEYSQLGLFYGKYLEVEDDEFIFEKINFEKCKMVASIIQNDAQMEAKGTEPCKFTYISVKESVKDKDLRSMVLFQEAKMIPTQLRDFMILVGDEKEGKKTITIDLDNPNEKDATKKTTVCPDVKGLDPSNTHKNKTFDTQKIDAKYIKAKEDNQEDNQLVLEVYADEIDNLTALKNAWLPNIEPIPLNVLAKTCRYQRWINILAFPDLGYELSFKSSSEADSLWEYKSKNFIKRNYKGNMGLLKGKELKQTKKKNKAALKEYKNSQKSKTLKDVFDYSGLQIAFEYSLGGVKQKEVSINGKHPVLNAIDTFNYITNIIRKLCFDKKVEEAAGEHDEQKVNNRKEKRNKHLAKLNKNGQKLHEKIKNKSKKLANKINKLAPFSIAITPPVFGGSIAWKLTSSKQKAVKNELGTEFSINFKADPLIGIEGRLDLLFIASKIPYIGQAITGMQKVVDVTDGADELWNWFVNLFKADEKYKIDIDVDYHLDLITSASYKPTWTAGVYHTIDGFSWGSLEAITEFEFGIEAMLKANIKLGDFRGEAVVGGSAKAKFVIKKENDNWVLDYQGLYVVFQANFEVKSKEDSIGEDNENTKEAKSGDRFPIQGPFTYEIKV